MNRDEAIKDLKMLAGLPPYDGWSNICAGDNYFAKSIETKYGMSISELERAVDFKKIEDAYKQKRAEFLRMK